MRVCKSLLHTVASGASFTSVLEFDTHDRLVVYAENTGFGSATPTATVFGAYNSGITAVALRRYDASAATHAAVTILINTAAAYEVPSLGAPYIQLVFNTAATGGASLKFNNPSNAG